MSNMRDLMEKLYNKNAEFGWDQKLRSHPILDRILMIDKISCKSVSPQMRTFYEFATSWKEGIIGFDTVDPDTLEDVYKNKDIEESLNLKAEDYKPLPPSDPSDWNRTALFAVEDDGHGLGLCLYWWRSENDVEPCVIYISGGTIIVFSDLMECVEHLVNGVFPEKGDRIYKDLQKQRGTLSD